MGTSAPENGIYGISGLWDLGIMGFVICGILVLWEKGGEEGRNRERKVGQEPWSIMWAMWLEHQNMDCYTNLLPVLLLLLFNYLQFVMLHLTVLTKGNHGMARRIF